MNNSEILIYQNPDGKIKIDVRLEEETVWLTQAQLCELFQKSKATISEHIKNVFEEGELTEISVVRNFRTTAADGKTYDTNYCRVTATLMPPVCRNLDRSVIPSRGLGLALTSFGLFCNQLIIRE